ncbi:MAG: hypothetical protein E7490_09505 [Ruminococcaceae bacterium]|nr:hypothetical protein [Oscillospiraceae bacterium]
MKFRRTLAALTAAAMAASSMAVIASAEEAAAVTDEQYFELIKTVKSVSATLTVNELAPETAGGFAAFYMQNNGGDWAWFASADEAESIKLDGAGEYEVVWSDVQSVISKTAGSLTLSLLKAPAETWESYPSFGIQVGSDGITAAGDEGKVDAKVTGVVITFTDDTTMELPEFAVAGDLLGKEEDWGLSGNNVMFNMAELIKAEMAKTPADDETGDDENTNDDETLGDSEEVPGDSEDVADEPETEGTVALELANGGRTVVDSGLVRTNIINGWTGDEADVLLDKEAFAGATLVSVKFTVTGVTEAFDAWLSFADKSWAVQYWGEGNEGNALADCTVVTIDKDGTYVVTATLEQAIEAMEFIAVCTNLEVEGEVSPITITIDELKIDVAEIEDTEVPGESSGEPTNPDTGVALVVVPAALAAAALATSGIVLKKRSK